MEFRLPIVVMTKTSYDRMIDAYQRTIGRLSVENVDLRRELGQKRGGSWGDTWTPGKLLGQLQALQEQLPPWLRPTGWRGVRDILAKVGLKPLEDK